MRIGLVEQRPCTWSKCQAQSLRCGKGARRHTLFVRANRIGGHSLDGGQDEAQPEGGDEVRGAEERERVG